jgi:hypothetical protein
MNVQTLDRKIWRKDLVAAYLQRCADNNLDAVIDFSPEGSCATAMGMYRLLDEFCQANRYAKSRVTIKTGNMREQHPEYNIVRDASYWYEVPQIQEWLQSKCINSGNTPSKHFGNFTSRSNWFRLWIATILASKYSDKTIQTYHYDPDRENVNYNGYIGIDDLLGRDCDCVREAVEFINTCPRTIDLDYLSNLDNCKDSIFQHQDSYYPIQHPSNLNLLQYYRDIFVDVVVEPNISGSCFLVTEKLWRAIIARRPFIVVSTAEYLANLRKLGFKTFSDYWNEDYDWAHNQHRIRQVDVVLDDIAKLSLQQLHTQLVDMQHILDHNYNVFMQLNQAQIEQAFL